METKLLDPDELKSLGQISSFRSLVTILHTWGSICIVIFACTQINQWWLYLFGYLFIAAKQHALAGMAHEGAHGLLFKNKLLNDWVTRLFFAFPIFVSHSRYKAIHLLHHRKLYTDQDPDRPIYQRYPVNPQLWKKFLWRDFTGRTIFKNLVYFVPLPRFLYPQHKDPIPAYPYQSDAYGLILYHLVVLTLCSYFDCLHWYALLWLLPYGTLLQVFLRIRGALEHGHIKDPENKYLNTRTTLDHPCMLFFLAPLGLNFHLEHHLYPTLPWYSLGHVHKRLLDQHPEAMWSFSYTRAIQELYTS